MAFIITGSVEDEKKYPKAVAIAEPESSVIGAVIRLNGYSSSDPDAHDLTYSWEFLAAPIGSKVVQEGFRELSEDSALVAFSPDVVGEYVVRLTVSNGLYEDTSDKRISIRAIMVPHGRGLVPDGKFIWSYLRDVWQGVEGKEWFETLWSALIQIAGAEMLKLYQTDFGKSIRDIQDLVQRRWLSYETSLSIDEDNASVWLGNHAAGTSATTKSLGLEAKALVFGRDNIVIIKGAVLPNVYGETLTIEYSQDPANVGTYNLAGLNQTKNGYSLIDKLPNATADRISYVDQNGVTQTEFEFQFGFQSTGWNRGKMSPMKYAERLSKFPDPPTELIRIEGSGITAGAGIRVGDVIYYPAGRNAGFYVVTRAAGTYIEVDRAPQGSSDDNGTVKAQVYRPIPVTVSQPSTPITGTFAIPLSEAKGLVDVSSGRIVTVGGRSFTMLRAVVDDRQEVPVTLVMTDEGDLVSGLSKLPWRVPHMLESSTQNFEELGVAPGDLLVFEVTNSATQTISSAVAQVVGVLKNKLGFVLTDEDVSPGKIPSIPDKTFKTLASDFGIERVGTGVDGSLLLAGDAKAIVDYIGLPYFQRQYFNTPLKHTDDIKVLGGAFRIHPKKIIRNSRIPVDDGLRSIPALQEYIQQPKDPSISPAILGENLDYVIDNGTVFSGEMIFKSGTNILDVEGAHFITRGLVPGDTFEIIEPAAIADTFKVVRVLSDDQLLLSKPITKYDLADPVTANVSIRRGLTGSTIRFVPGTFTAAHPAPERLWAEVSFFDNSDTIEKNFGILVGLSKSDLDDVSRDINYRQAVAGLMFAYTRGSALNKLRLGAQILLGLPFAEHAGVIRSIENDYRLDAKGNPVLGRILIEDTDADGKPEGTLRVYLFPIDPQSTTLSGVETNPATKQMYKVGDTVEIFAALCKGVQALDYLTNPVGDTMPDFMKIQQLHSFTLRVSDKLMSLREMDLTSRFLRRITPAYISYVVQTATELRDQISVVDALKLAIVNRDTGVLADNIGFHLATAFMFDARSYSGVYQANGDLGLLWIRKTGSSAATERKLDIGDPTTVTISNANLITPTSGEGPVARAGDYLFIFDGPDKGYYPITAVDEGEVTVDFPPGFQDGNSLMYAIARPYQALLREGTSVLSNAAAVDIYGAPVVGAPTVGDVLVEDGLTADGVAVGDWFLADYGGDIHRHIITAVLADHITGAYNHLQVTPAFPGAVPSADYRIYRPQLLGSPYMGGRPELTVAGGVYTDLVNHYYLAMLDPGDELLIEDPPGFARLTVLDPKAMKFQPVLPNGTYQCRVCKRGFPDFPSFASTDKFSGWDEALVILKNPAGVGQVACTSGSANVPFDTNTGVLPGDALKIATGGNSTVDQGYGPGVYQIIGVQPGQVTLSHPLTATGAADWQLLRRR